MPLGAREELNPEVLHSDRTRRRVSVEGQERTHQRSGGGRRGGVARGVDLGYVEHATPCGGDVVYGRLDGSDENSGRFRRSLLREKYEDVLEVCSGPRVSVWEEAVVFARRRGEDVEVKRTRPGHVCKGSE